MRQLLLILKTKGTADMGKSKIIGVDFDGTLCDSAWPEMGEANVALIEYLKKKKTEGDKLILWTCREGKELEMAVSWCKEHNLYFDSVNDNLPEVIEYYGTNSRKISCDIYIDDKAFFPKVYKQKREGINLQGVRVNTKEMDVKDKKIMNILGN